MYVIRTDMDIECLLISLSHYIFNIKESNCHELLKNYLEIKSPEQHLKTYWVFFLINFLIFFLSSRENYLQSFSETICHMYLRFYSVLGLDVKLAQMDGIFKTLSLVCV